VSPWFIGVFMTTGKNWSRLRAFLFSLVPYPATLCARRARLPGIFQPHSTMATTPGIHHETMSEKGFKQVTRYTADECPAVVQLSQPRTAHGSRPRSRPFVGGKGSGLF
jgi:hypothetical protein